MKIYCCECLKDVNATLVSGKEVYPHRRDLHTLPFWQCPVCENYVGCHHKTDTPTKPLGSIPTSDLRVYRQMLHEMILKLWGDNDNLSISDIYKRLSKDTGKNFHVGEVRTLKEVERVLEVIESITGVTL